MTVVRPDYALRPVIILATGARRIAGLAARTWLLSRVLILNPVGIVAGDADGSDRDATDIASERGIPWQRFTKHGTVERSEGPPARWTGLQPPDGAAGRIAWAVWLHARNKAAVDHVVSMMGRYDARCLAALARSEGTNGAVETANYAESRGIPVEREWF